MLLSLALALGLAAAAPADTVPAVGTVRGVVQSDPSGLPVAHAVVEVGGARAVAFTDSAGAYVVHGVQPGRHTLRVRHLEHAPLAMEVLVPASVAVTLDLSLRYRPLALDTVVASRRALRMADTVPVRRHEVAWMDARALEDAPGLASSPASPVPPESPPTPEEVFRIRGAAAELKLVLLDGAPVFAPFHMAGLMESFEPGVLSAARLYVGGAPARFDGGLAHVLDLTTRGGNAERHSSAGSVDLVASRAMVDGPLGGGATYLASGRVVHTGWMRGGSPYDYSDGLVRLDAPLAGGAVRATAFGNREGARLNGGRLFAGWRNLAGSVGYRGGLLGSEGELTAAAGQDAGARIRFGDHVLEERSFTQRGRVALDLSSAAGPVRLRYGASFDYTRVRYRVEELVLGGWENVVGTLTYASTAAGYLDGVWQPGRRLRLRGGVRGDMFSYSPVQTLSPRGSVTWLLADRSALTLAAGRYHQYVRTSGAPGDTSSGTFADSLRRSLPSALAVASANHMSVGLDQELVDGVRLGVEGFFKRFRGVPTLPGRASYTSGMDLWMRRGTGPVTGWVGYNLAWSWSLLERALSAEDITGRQVLSAGFSAAVGRAGRMSARFQYGSNLSVADLVGESPTAYRAEALSGAVNNASATPSEVVAAGARPYVRLDAELSRTWTPRLAGRETEVTPFFRLINALDQREPLFHQRDQAGRDVRVGSFPVLPVLGVSWKF
jgi:hypothetical protein